MHAKDSLNDTSFIILLFYLLILIWTFIQTSEDLALELAIGDIHI